MILNMSLQASPYLRCNRRHLSRCVVNTIITMAKQMKTIPPRSNTVPAVHLMHWPTVLRKVLFSHKAHMTPNVFSMHPVELSPQEFSKGHF